MCYSKNRWTYLNKNTKTIIFIILIISANEEISFALLGKSCFVCAVSIKSIISHPE